MASKEDLKKKYDEKIIPLRFSGVGGSGIEIIDVISNYPWTASTLKGGSNSNNISFQHNIPFCYVVEYKQTVNSNIANFINTIKIGLDSAASLGTDMLNTAIKNTSQDIQNEQALNAYVRAYQKGLSEIKDKEGTPEYNEARLKMMTELNTTKEIVEKHTFREDEYIIHKSAIYEAALDAAADIAKKQAAETGGTAEKPEKIINDAIAAARANPQSSSDTTSSGNLSQMINKGATKMLSTLQSLKGQYEKHVENFLKGKDTTHLNSEFLSPYQYLYYTERTNKHFVFPVMTPTELLNLNHSYGTDSKGFDVFGIGDFAKSAADIFAGGTNILNFFNSRDNQNPSGGMEEQYAEMAKSFSFSPEGQELTINFPLFNTTVKDAWKKNYRFLAVFLLRNLPFKVSAYSYKPPLLYDIVVPGTNHLPLCYVSNINIQHYGLIRHLTCENFYNSVVDKVPDKMQVPVPEAWFVSIRFKCLLSNTSNLMLNLVNSPITVQSKGVSITQ